MIERPDRPGRPTARIGGYALRSDSVRPGRPSVPSAAVARPGLDSRAGAIAS
jgi:hypothetical protein